MALMGHGRVFPIDNANETTNPWLYTFTMNKCELGDDARTIVGALTLQLEWHERLESN